MFRNIFSGIVQIENVHPYLKCKSKYNKKNRTALFQLAVKEADEYMETGGNVSILFFFKFKFRIFRFISLKSRINQIVCQKPVAAL